MSQEKIAIVTGGNKGVGFAITKGLCEKFKGKVYLTSRDINRGKEAVAKLKKLGLNPVFHQLDIDDPTSVKQFKNYIKHNHGGVDVLVNNAGIIFKNDCKEPISTQAEVTVKINYFGTLSVTEVLLPLLRKDSQIVHVSSACGHLSKIPSPELKKKLSSKDLTIRELNELMNDFVRSAQNGTNEELGWGRSAYFVSKVGVSAMTRVRQRIAEEEFPEKNHSFNSCHPGYIATDMTNFKAPLSTEEGAKGSLYLALEPHGLKGQYVWYDCAVVDWCGVDTPFEPSL